MVLDFMFYVSWQTFGTRRTYFWPSLPFKLYHFMQTVLSNKRQVATNARGALEISEAREALLRATSLPEAAPLAAEFMRRRR